MNRHLASLIILLAAAFLYPVIVLAGGTPRFPDRLECARPAKTDGSIDAVFGRYRDHRTATSMLRRVLAVGFKGSQIEGDGCGLLKVVVHGIPTLAVGRDLVAEARTVGMRPTLESAAP